MKKFNIVFVIDKNYFFHINVLIKSIIENNDKQKIFFHIITNENLNNFFVKKLKIKYKIYLINGDIFKRFKITHHITHSTYYRFLIPNILPEYIDKVLYLDADTIVDGDISEIFELEFDDDTYLYACDHYSKPEQKMHLRNLGLSEYDDYFNAGVMYIDLEKWRKVNISKVLMDFALKRKDDILWWDQDVLNVVFHKKWKKLHPKFNVIWEVLESDDKNSEIKEAKKNPVIVHYTRSVKPWHSNSYHPLKHLYWKYIYMLPEKIIRGNHS